MAAQTCTFTAAIDSTWNNAGNWDTTVEADRVPLADDIVVIPTGLTAVVNVTRIPATAGKIASLTGTGTGAISIPMNTIGASVLISVTGNIQAGTTNFLLSTGASSNTLTIDCAEIVSSGTVNVSALYNTSGANITVNGTPKGGSASGTMGIADAGTSNTLTVNGNPTGGSALNSCGVRVTSNGRSGVCNGNPTGGEGAGAFGWLQYCTGPMTIGDSYNIIDGAGGQGYAGPAPHWHPSATSYISFETVDGTKTFAPVLAAASIKKDVVSGGGAGAVTGTYAFNVNGISVSGPA